MSYQKFTKDVGIIAIAHLFAALEGIIVLPVITKLLGAENYGIWTQITITISLSISFLTLGLPYTLVRFLAGEKREKEIRDGIWSSLTIIFGLCLLTVLIMTVFSGSLSQFFGKEKTFLELLAVILLFSCMNEVLFNVFRAFHQNGRYAFFFILQTLGEAGLITLALFTTRNLLNATLSLLVIRIFVFLLMATLVIKKVGIAAPRFSRLKEYLAFGLPSIPGNISTWVVQSSNRYLIGIFLGTIFVGYYNPANMISGSLTLFTAPLCFILPAALSKLYDEGRIEEVRKYLYFSLKYFLMIGIPSVFGLSILSRQLLTIFSTSDIADHSYRILPFIACSFLFYGIHGIISQVLVLKKKTGTIAAIWIAAAFLNLGLNLALIRYIGILGAALSNFLTYIFVLILTWRYSFIDFSFKIDLILILKIFFASAVMTLAIGWYAPSGFGSTLAAITGSALIYGVLIFLLKTFNKSEIEFFKKCFKKDHIAPS